MKIDTITGLNTIGKITFINLDTIFQMDETDFSEWQFYDDFVLDAIFSTAAGPGNTTTSKIKEQGSRPVQAA